MSNILFANIITMELTKRKAKKKCQEKFLPKMAKELKKKENATFSESQSQSEHSATAGLSDVLGEFSGSNLDLSSSSAASSRSPPHIGGASGSRFLSPVRIGSVRSDSSSPSIGVTRRTVRSLSPVSDEEMQIGQISQQRQPILNVAASSTPANQGGPSSSRLTGVSRQTIRSLSPVSDEAMLIQSDSQQRRSFLNDSVSSAPSKQGRPAGDTTIPMGEEEVTEFHDHQEREEGLDPGRGEGSQESNLSVSSRFQPARVGFTSASQDSGFIDPHKCQKEIDKLRRKHEREFVPEDVRYHMRTNLKFD